MLHVIWTELKLLHLSQFCFCHNTEEHYVMIHCSIINCWLMFRFFTNYFIQTNRGLPRRHLFRSKCSTRFLSCSKVFSESELLPSQCQSPGTRSISMISVVAWRSVSTFSTLDQLSYVVPNRTRLVLDSLWTGKPSQPRR